MSSVDVHTSEACFIAAGEIQLFAIWTEPLGETNGLTVTILPGRDTMAGRNRVFARLASALASQGFRVLRLEYGSTTESTGAPIREAGRLRVRSSEAQAALAWVEERGHRRHVLVGSCFGALVAMTAAAELPRIEQMVLVTPPIDSRPRSKRARPTARAALARALETNVVGGLSDPQRRRAYVRMVRRRLARVTRHHGPRPPRIQGSWSADLLGAALDRGVSVRLLYGARDAERRGMEAGKSGPLGPVLERDNVEVRVVPGALHGFPTLSSQQTAIDAVVSWLADAR